MCGPQILIIYYLAPYRKFVNTGLKPWEKADL